MTSSVIPSMMVRNPYHRISEGMRAAVPVVLQSGIPGVQDPDHEDTGRREDHGTGCNCSGNDRAGGERPPLLLPLRRRHDSFRGECLCQPQFARDLLRAAKERGINTAIESMACVPWKNIEMVLPYLDTYLMDIKHTNQAKHEQFTGKPNGLALENARKVALSGQTNLVIRVPVIPTFNDSVEEIKSIASFASTLPGVKKIHLLPYHRLGQDKYDWLGREYKLPEILPPEPEHMELLKKAVHSVCDLDCQIGG